MRFNKKSLWLLRFKSGNLTSFTTLTDLLERNDKSATTFQTKVVLIDHLEKMKKEFEKYFPFLIEVSDGGNNWIT